MVLKQTGFLYLLHNINFFKIIIMRKITLLFAIIIAGFAVQAQELDSKSISTINPNTGQNSLSVIWDQSTVGTSGIISDYSNNVDNAVYSADDFEITEPTKITSITVNGFQNDANILDIINGS